MSGASRRGFLRGAGSGGRDARPRRLRRALAGAVVPQRPVQRRAADDRRAARGARRERPRAANTPRPTSRRSSGRTAAPSPDDPAYVAMAANGFADWRLKVDGLVETPAEFSLADLRAMPSRTQITRHDCVEGWSCIGKWKGVPLGHVLEQAKLKPEARYLVFHCADALEKTLDGSGHLLREHRPRGRVPSADDPRLRDERRGAARSRTARRCGCGSSASSATRWRNTSCASRRSRALPASGAGKGGFWEDRGYEWYAGI